MWSEVFMLETQEIIKSVLQSLPETAFVEAALNKCQQNSIWTSGIFLRDSFPIRIKSGNWRLSRKK